MKKVRPTYVSRAF